MCSSLDAQQKKASEARLKRASEASMPLPAAYGDDRTNPILHKVK